MNSATAGGTLLPPSVLARWPCKICFIHEPLILIYIVGNLTFSCLLTGSQCIETGPKIKGPNYFHESVLTACGVFEWSFMCDRFHKDSLYKQPRISGEKKHIQSIKTHLGFK